ncbi:Embryo defective 1273, putative [Theobroma cacao]|uniref:Embryo defective 1273, putative n=1 Tax=Theobroma cacao TaxID=3641 RepID=A0A061FMB1_THECC|nr:Embryo defective 1273, putative [Theobroma cacao]
MAILASAVLPSTLNIKVKQLEHQPSQLHGFLQLNGHRRVSPRRRMKVTMAQFCEPNKIREQLNIIKERLWETTPETVKDFPWKKAENLLLERLLFVGHKALKLSLVTVFVISSLSDFLYSISRNQELMVPFGLIVGCLMTDFLKETSQEAFRSPEEKGLKWHLLAIGCFFVVVKFVSALSAIRTRVFLLHVANGGLMQALWLWRSLLEEHESNGSSAADAQS